MAEWFARDEAEWAADRGGALGACSGEGMRIVSGDMRIVLPASVPVVVMPSWLVSS